MLPKDWTDEEATNFVNDKSPTGISSKWVMKKKGNSTLSGDDERVTCAKRWKQKNRLQSSKKNIISTPHGLTR